MTTMTRSLGVVAAFALLPVMISTGRASSGAHFDSPAGSEPASATVLSTRPVAGHLQPEVHASSASDRTPATDPASLLYAPGGPYFAGAFAISNGNSYTATGDTQSDAEYNALTHCHQETSNANCQGAQWVLNGWLALAEYYTGSASAPVVQWWAISAGQTGAEANTNAVNFCNKLAGADVCTYIGEEQSPSTTESYTHGPPSVGANDYPTFLATPAKDYYNPDPWGFENRECTSFVAWRVNDNNGVYFNNTVKGPNGKSATFGNASNWMNAATSIGYTYNTTPTARSIAWWGDDYDGAGSAGHVAYVDSVTMNGSEVAGITVEQYNWGIPLNQGNYSTLYVPVSSGAYPERFIHGLEGTQLITG
jgi:surface antigen